MALIFNNQPITKTVKVDPQQQFVDVEVNKLLRSTDILSKFVMQVQEKYPETLNIDATITQKSSVNAVRKDGSKPLKYHATITVNGIEKTLNREATEKLFRLLSEI